jgi:hypothetical protein
LAGTQRLAEEGDGEDHADARLEVAEDGSLPCIEAGQAVTAENEGQGGAAGSEVEEQQDIVPGQRTDPDGCQLEAGARQQEEQTIARAPGDDGERIPGVKGPPPEDGIGGTADRTGHREHVAEGRGAEGCHRTQENDSGESTDRDE